MPRQPPCALLRLATPGCAVVLAFAVHAARAEGGAASAGTPDALAHSTWGERDDAGAARRPELTGLVLDGRDVPVALPRLPPVPGGDDAVGIEALLRGLGLAP